MRAVTEANDRREDVVLRLSVGGFRKAELDFATRFVCHASARCTLDERADVRGTVELDVVTTVAVDAEGDAAIVLACSVR